MRRSIPPKAVSGRIDDFKNRGLFPEDIGSIPPGDVFNQKVVEIYAAYQERLKKCNALDFGDMLIQTVRLLEQFPEVCSYYRERFQWILVDEYQDTNPVQYQLIRLLAGERKNLCVVGDDDQSIYSWRGADIRNILEFEKDFPGVKIIRLEQNYRSTATILAAAGAVVKQNFGRKGKTLWTENPARASRSATSGSNPTAKRPALSAARSGGSETVLSRWRRWRSSTAPMPSRA